MSGKNQALLFQQPQGVFTFLQNATQTSAGTSSFTFTSQNIGTASSDRYIVIAIAGGSGSNINISSVTIGGNTMTKDAGTVTAQATVTGVWRLLVTSGTSANVVVTFTTSNAQFCSINMFSLTSFGTLAGTYASFSNITASSNVVSGTLNNRAGGAVIFITSRFQSGTAPTITAYTGCNVQDVNQANNTTNRTWVGHLYPTTLAQSRSFTVTYSGGSTVSTTGVSY